LASPTTTLEIFLHGLPMICKVPAQKFHIQLPVRQLYFGSKWCGVAPMEWLISFWLVVVKRH
jgi:hypothetical protein